MGYNIKLTQRISGGILIILLVLGFSSCRVTRNLAEDNLTIVFYNVENLFDTINESGKTDGEFTPEGSKNWTQDKLDKKINDISRVLSSVNKTDLPEIIGLCEVENSFVLDKLINTDSLSGGDYKIIHYESPDFRGIDNAFLFRPAEFKVVFSEPIKIKFAGDPDYKTRDILYVKGETVDKEEFHFFINHWPSRIGGDAETEPQRMFVASIVRNKVDSILNIDRNANIVILGDMNDEPVNNSLFHTLGAKDPEADPEAELQNLMFETDKQDLGSYNYRGNWNMLDNIVVSKSLLDEKGFICVEKRGFVFHKEWMEYKNRNGNISPNRTYSGNNYTGGISDHFPVYFILKK